MAPNRLLNLWQLCRGRALAASLALGLVLANLALTLHHYDFAAHQGQHTCEVCTSSDLGHALICNLADGAGLDFDNALLHYREVSSTPRVVVCYHARAPPV